MVVVQLQMLVVLYTALMILREVISLNFTNVIVLLMSPNTANSVILAISVWNSRPDTVVTAPSLLSFSHQLAKFDFFMLIFNF